ncbi:hypothetical protein LPB142_14905 [Rhodobacter xanthinilyticus]|uniref:Peptidase inhibitor I78 family protein n=1 Tax=Rhodobacter xanthinilyticus TaxID=1850250 RepID=A0A1D9MF89_9RHOB|nr:I78 family peptidase inhibitor [Rhodobacter xanthinilyticus]AOZ70463.1 hypothetical protein LPB142_14905 [Rhodobacter xanthinilyticus]
MLIRLSLIAAAALSLAACQSPVEDTPPQPLPTPHMTPAVTQTGPLEQREPDTCHAADHIGVLGQPASVIPTLGITRAINVVEWRGIEPQEYNPQRVVFRLDAAGNIFNIDCG